MNSDGKGRVLFVVAFSLFGLNLSLFSFGNCFRYFYIILDAGSFRVCARDFLLPGGRGAKERGGLAEDIMKNNNDGKQT